MNTTKSQITIDAELRLLDKINKANLEKLATKSKRTDFPIEFIDNDYNQIENALEIFFLKKKTDERASEVLKWLIKNKETRKNEIKNFLARHKIQIDILNNDYREFDDFIKKNVNYSNYFELEDWVLADIWISILLDMTLLIGDYFTKDCVNVLGKSLRWKYVVNHSSLYYRELGIAGLKWPDGTRNDSFQIQNILFRYGRRFIDIPDPSNKPILPLSQFLERFYKEILPKS